MRLCTDQPVTFRSRSLKCVKYVDDCLFLERVCVAGAERFSADGETVALARPNNQKVLLERWRIMLSREE